MSFFFSVYFIACSKEEADEAPFYSSPEKETYSIQGEEDDEEFTYSILGDIFDLQGGIVPGATVELLDATGAVLYQAISDASGRYRLNNVKAGSYYLRISIGGCEVLYEVLEVNGDMIMNHNLSCN